MSQRIHYYIDGYNLYHGLRSLQLRKYYWLDLWALALAHAQPGEQVTGMTYFTAKITSPPDSVKRQSTYFEALAAHRPNIKFVWGHYLSKSMQCRACATQWTRSEEKMTDVNIACQLIGDCMDDRFDKAIIVSGDSDLVPPVAMIKARWPSKKVVIACPPNRKSINLCQEAHAFFALNEKKIKNSQLPLSVPGPTGYLLTKPAKWS